MTSALNKTSLHMTYHTFQYSVASQWYRPKYKMIIDAEDKIYQNVTIQSCYQVEI